VLVAAGVAQLLATLWPTLASVLIVGSLLLIPLVGLIPGVRELEVTAGRSLLQAAGELVVPEPPTGQHRGLTVIWATLHLAAGLLTGLLLLGALPAAVATGVAAVRGQPIELAGRLLVPEIAFATGRIAVLAAALAAVVGCLAVVWLLGLVAVRMVPRFLGPTAQDRLVLAEARLATEAEHTRVARELHDGIGHALTIITMQAAGARRGSDPDRARTALAVVEDTARQALTELDAVLGLLRDGGSGPRDERDLTEVDALVTGHRRTGLSVTLDAKPVSDLPAVVSTTAYRVVAEALSNAQRYGGAGSAVLVSWGPVPGGLVVEVCSQLPAAPLPRVGTGQGLDLLRERVELLGGRLEAAPRDTTWVVRAELPTGGRRA
jgi:signal transduction histidine kinase